MRTRTNSYSNKQFWGCAGYATNGCDYTEEFDE